MYSRNPAVIDALLDCGADINDTSHKDGYSPLIWAIRCNREPRIAERLIELGADINHQDKYGNTALEWAVCNINPKDVEKQLMSAINNSKTLSNVTVSLASIKQTSKTRLVPLLLKHDPSSDSLINSCILAYALSPAQTAIQIIHKIRATKSIRLGYEDKGLRNDIYLICLSSEKDKVAAYIDWFKSDSIFCAGLQKTQYGIKYPVAFSNQVVLDALIRELGLKATKDTVEWTIGSCKDYKLLDSVINSCDNVNKQDLDGRTALYYAVNSDNANAVEALIAHGAKIDMREGKLYHTELIEAVNRQSPSLAIIKALLKAGADVNARDKDGSTVLMYAVNKNITADAANLLINAGAKLDAKKGDDYVYEYCNSSLRNTSLYTKLYNAALHSSWW